MGRRLSWEEIKAAACLLVAYIDLQDRGLPKEDYQAWKERAEQMFAEKPIERLTATVHEILETKGYKELEQMLGVAA